MAGTAHVRAAPLRAAPRRSLCNRATRWLAGITGLALACAVVGRTGLLTPTPEPFERVLPEDPGDGGAPATALATPSPAPVPPPDEFPAERNTDPVHVTQDHHTAQTLTQALDQILADGDPLAVETFALQLGGEGSRAGLSVAALERLVEAYRHCRSWREAHALYAFVEGVMLAIGPMRVTDEHLQHLLRTWSWRYGEAEARMASGHHLKEAALVKSFTYALAQGLGGPSMPESQLHLLIGTACREPDDIAPGSITDSMLSRHAAWAASAMMQVIYAISRPSLHAASDDKKYIAAAQVMRCLQIFLRSPSADHRWKTTVVAALSVAELPMTHGTRQLREAWRTIILTEVQKYVAETVPGLEPAPDFKRSMTALYDPNLLRTGRLLEFWSAPDDER